METIDLFLDNSNSLDFNVSIESTKQFDASCRLMIEAEGLSYSFPGEIDDGGDVSITVPAMKGLIKEGKYDTSLEIIVDDRLFKPLEFVANFENSVTVKAEHSVRKNSKNVITATAKFKGKKSKVLKESKPKPAATRKTSQKSNSNLNRQVKALRQKLEGKNIDLTGLTEAQLKQFILSAQKTK